jgi:peptide/nickel transport system ATP-binding protein
MPDALTVENVDVAYRVRGRDRPVLRDVSFRVRRGECYGLVGESGCGKSTLALAAVRYLARNGRVRSGSITIDGRDVLGLNAGELRTLRARTVSMVYQEPGQTLNPAIRVGRQVAEVFEIAGCPRAEAVERAREMLGRVWIADVGSVMERYPHQLSGGMLQRVSIAMALAAEPSLLVLDEPTTALDATVEAEVLDLINAIRDEFGTSLLFISHNLGVIARMCDRVGVLYAGELVEEAAADRVFREPRHPYTVGLLRCVPRRGQRKDRDRLETIPGSLPAPGEMAVGCIFAARCELADERCVGETPMLRSVEDGHAARCHHVDRVDDLLARPPEQLVQDSPADGGVRESALAARGVSKTFRQSGATVRALADVEIELRRGETLGLVGESGSGKSTLARVLLGLTEPDAGAVVEIGSREVAPTAGRRSWEDMKALQIVFQDPNSALNRRHTAGRTITRVLRKLGGLRGAPLRARLAQLAEEVRLAPRHLSARPAQLSGGLKQRVAIARAFAGDPQVVICDEPTSALDVSVQAAILNLLVELQRREHVTYLFISHDLGVVRYLSDRIAVLYLGRVMEIGAAEDVFSGPHHPYTEALLSAVPSIDGALGERIKLSGEIPSAADPPSGCVFHTRCHRKLGAVCETQEPPLRETAVAGHAIRCHIEALFAPADQHPGEAKGPE